MVANCCVKKYDDDAEGEENVQQITEPVKQVNGISSEYQESDVVEDGSVKSAGLDVDVNGRAESGNTGKDGESQDDGVPKYSVKKASSFKPVSVTKTFLMKAGSAAALPKSGIDKGLFLPFTSFHCNG